MKMIIYIWMLIFTISCSSIKIINNTNCNVNEHLIKKELKKQRANFNVIEVLLMGEEKNNQCIVFYFDIKNQENIRDYVKWGVILKTSTNIYINTYYILGKLRIDIDENKVKDYINDALKSFRMEYNNIFDKEELDKIEEDFRYGIDHYNPVIIEPLREDGKLIFY
jgi:hypothetical protein